MSEWQAYFSLEPFGERRADYRNALLCCILANANRGKDQKAFEVSDFLPTYPEDLPDEDAEEPEPWKEQLAMAELITAAYGGKDMRQK